MPRDCTAISTLYGKCFYTDVQSLLSFFRHTILKMKSKTNSKLNRLSAQVSSLSSKLAAEPKHYQVYSSGNMANTGTVVPITNVAQGDTVSSRDGNQIKAHSFDIRISVVPDAANARTQLVRFLVVQDLQQILGSNPTPSDILAVVTGDVTEAPYKISSLGRFRILADERLHLATTHSLTTRIRQRCETIVRYSSSSASDISKNGLYLLYFSNFNTVNMPTCSIWTDFVFYDN